METILAGKRPPSPTTKKRKPPMKAKSSRFDSLVARYYPAVYSFASRLTDDPREANAWPPVDLCRSGFWRPPCHVTVLPILQFSNPTVYARKILCFNPQLSNP